MATRHFRNITKKAPFRESEISISLDLNIKNIRLNEKRILGC